MSNMPSAASEAEIVCLANKEDIKTKKSYYGALNIFSFLYKIFEAIQNAQVKRAERIIKHNTYYL